MSYFAVQIFFSFGNALVFGLKIIKHKELSKKLFQTFDFGK